MQTDVVRRCQNNEYDNMYKYLVKKRKKGRNVINLIMAIIKLRSTYINRKT